MLVRGWGRCGVNTNGHEVSSQGNENGLRLIVVLVAQLCIYNGKRWIIYTSNGQIICRF